MKAFAVVSLCLLVHCVTLVHASPTAAAAVAGRRARAPARPPKPSPSLNVAAALTKRGDDNDDETMLMGCYEDSNANFFANQSYPDYPNNAYRENYFVPDASQPWNSCYAHCRKVGAGYFALSGTSVCTCGVYHDESRLVMDQDLCNIPCQDVGTCGGVGVASVYYIPFDQGDCPDNFVYFDGVCYSMSYVSLSWNQAQSDCRNQGGALATVRDMEHSQFILSLADGGAVWVGGYRFPRTAEMPLAWAEALSVTFTDWREWEPNQNVWLTADQVCVAAQNTMPTAYSGSWVERPCSHLLRFVCAVNISSEFSTITSLSVASAFGLDFCVTDGEKGPRHDGLIGWYQLSPSYLTGGKSFTDRSPTGVEVSLPPNTNAQWTTGLSASQALVFNGSVMLTASKTYPLATNLLTVAAWIRPSTQVQQNRMVVSKTFDRVSNPSNPEYMWGIGFDAIGFLCFFVGADKVCAQSGLEEDEWVHVTGLYDGTVIYLYINGNLVDWQWVGWESPIVPNSETFLVIGGAYHEVSTSSTSFIGAIDDVRIYRTAVGLHVIMYLVKCVPTTGGATVIPVYRSDETVIDFFLGGSFSNELVALSPSPCQVDSDVNANPMGTWMDDDTRAHGSITVKPHNLNTSVSMFHLCLLSHFAWSKIAADLQFSVLAVQITRINDIESSGLVTISSNETYPITIQVRGTGLEYNQGIFLSTDEMCHWGNMKPLPFDRIASEGSLMWASVTINSRPGDFVYVCWAPSVNGTIEFQPTPFAISFEGDDSATSIIAMINGSSRVTSLDVYLGFFASSSNFFRSCSDYVGYGDNFFLAVTMGAFTDYLIPNKEVSVCSLLLAGASHKNYRYSPISPLSQNFTSRSRYIPPFSDDTVLGGSPAGFAVAEGRSRLTFWGDDENELRVGGCCQAARNDPVAWYRRYRISIGAIEKNSYWFDLTRPQAAAEGVFLSVAGALVDVRRARYGAAVRYTITIGNDMSMVIPTSEGVFNVKMNIDNYKAGDELLIRVSIDSDVPVRNGRQFTRRLIVADPFPPNATVIDPDIPLYSLLHFGPMDQYLPSSMFAAQEYDWFTSAGGEDLIRPSEFLESEASAGFMQPVTATWQVVKSQDANFTWSLPDESVSFFAVGLYVSAAQSVRFDLQRNGAALLLVDGEVVVDAFDGYNAPSAGDSNIDLAAGWHQVFIKTYTDGSPGSLRLRILGSAIGWYHQIPTTFPPGTYRLIEGMPLTNALHLGESITDHFVGGFYDNYVGNIATLKPATGDITNRKVWKNNRAENGNWPISGAGVAAGEFAVSFLSFVMYATQGMWITWDVGCGGRAEIFLNGNLAFECNSDITDTIQTWRPYLEYGWYQVIVRYGAARGDTWFFSMTPYGTGNRIAWASRLRSQLPVNVRPFPVMQPIHSMLSLQSRWGSTEIPIWGEGEDQLGFAHVDLTMIPNPGKNLGVRVYGVEKVFRWTTLQHRRGDFGSVTDEAGGYYNQYYSISLYCTDDTHNGLLMTLQLSNTANASYTLWMDSEYVTSAGPVQDALPLGFELKAGWHNAVIKLRGPDSFTWFNSSNTTTYSQAAAFCQSEGHGHLCTMEAFCPFGSRRASISGGEGSLLVPVFDWSEDYMQIGLAGGSGLDTCQVWSDVYGTSPAWAMEETEVEGRTGFACCASVTPPTLSVQLAYSGMGECGMSTSYPEVVLEAPEVTTDNENSLVQTITITHSDENAELYFTTDTSISPVDGTRYTGPFKVEEDVTILAQAVSGKYKSDVAVFQVYIPKDIAIGRRECMVSVPCSVDTFGTAPGWHFALLSVSRDKELSDFLNYTYARQQEVSGSFSGLLVVRQDLRFLVNGMHADSYYVISYKSQSTGTVGVEGIAFNAPKVTPTTLVGYQNSRLSVDGGVVDRDGILFVEPLYQESQVVCNRQTCVNAFTNNMDEVGMVAGGTVAVDLYGFSGEIKCMCVCSTGSELSRNGEFHYTSDAVGNWAVNITVVSPDPPDDTVMALSSDVVPNDGTLQFYGKFTESSVNAYTVSFAPISDQVTASNNLPLCPVTNASSSTLSCRALVPVGTRGYWKTMVYLQGQPVAYEGARNNLTLVPPPLEVISAVGECASRSDSCVTGQMVTFYGTNLESMNPDVYEVILSSSLYPVAPTCVVVNVYGNLLTCVLTVPNSTPLNAYYWVSITLSVSPSVKVTYATWNTLLFRGGDVPGWSGNSYIPVNPDDHSLSPIAKRIIIIIAVVLGVVILALTLTGVVICIRYRLVPKRDRTEEEMNFMEEQLLRAERESTQSLQRMPLSRSLPPLPPSDGENEDWSINETPEEKPAHPLNDL